MYRNILSRIVIDMNLKTMLEFLKTPVRDAKYKAVFHISYHFVFKQKVKIPSCIRLMSGQTYSENLALCEHRKSFKVGLAIFQHHTWKG